MDPVITLNVGGRVFQTYQSTLKKFPETMMARCFESGLAKPNEKGEYFFDRNGTVFEAILDAYRTGQIIRPPTIDIETFNEELRYWGFEPLPIPESKPSSTSIFNVDQFIIKVIPLMNRYGVDEMGRCDQLLDWILEAKEQEKSEFEFLNILTPDTSDYTSILKKFFNVSEIRQQKYPAESRIIDGCIFYYYIRDNVEHDASFFNVYSKSCEPYVMVVTCKF